MSTLADVFNSTTGAFSLIEMTDSINLQPFQQKRLGQMGLFREQPVSKNTVAIEERNGVLSLLPALTRGSGATQATHEKRNVRSFAIPHIPYEDVVLAADLQDVRKFGSADQAQGPAQVVADRLKKMRADHEATLEFMRLSAIKGTVTDGAGSTLFVLATEFNVSAPSAVDFVLNTATTDVGLKIQGVKETIEDEMGDTAFDHIHCLCGRGFWKKLTSHDDVKYAFQYFQEGSLLREDPRSGFEFKGVTFEVYRGAIGSTNHIDESSLNTAYFFPVGAPELFVTYYGPADFVETVNTLGLPVYAKQAVLEFERGIKIHTQSNPLPLCTRPGAVVSGTSAL